MIKILGEPFNVRKTDGKTYKYVVYECECGNREATQLCNANKAKSCGCLNKRSKRHLMTKTAIYSVWGSMISRCYNPNNKRFKDYGGRGIVVCDEWKTFENFFRDMGECNGLTLDRKDNNGIYCKDNCQWSTGKIQCRNRRNTIFLTVDNVIKSMSEWSEYPKADTYNTISARYYRGWCHKECIFGKKN
jgi:hypothetical protein